MCGTREIDPSLVEVDAAADMVHGCCWGSVPIVWLYPIEYEKKMKVKLNVHESHSQARQGSIVRSGHASRLRGHSLLVKVIFRTIVGVLISQFSLFS